MMSFVFAACFSIKKPNVSNGLQKTVTLCSKAKVGKSDIFNLSKVCEKKIGGKNIENNGKKNVKQRAQKKITPKPLALAV